MRESEVRYASVGRQEAGGGRLRAASEAFCVAAEGSLARFESRWAHELELGLQEFDARYGQIVEELKLFFTPRGVMPKLPLPASMAEVFRAHVDEVVCHLQSRETRLVEELRGELEAELLGYLQSAEAGRFAAPDASLEATGAPAAGAAAGSVPFQCHAWALVALSTPVHIDNILELVDSFVDDCFELLCGKLPPGLSLLVKAIRKVWQWGKKPVKVLGMLRPHRLLLWVLKKLASPGRRLMLATLPLAVKQAMSRARARLKSQFEAHAATVVQQGHEFIERTRQDMEASPGQ